MKGDNIKDGDKGLCLEGQFLTIKDVQSVARGCPLFVSEDEKILSRMEKAQNVVRDSVENCEAVYGVTTGFGGMVDVSVPTEQAEALQANLLSFLSSGAGNPVDSTHVRAAMALRANMLLRGASGVRMDIVERLVRFLNAGFTPIVGELGSIGASGDLVPLATIARAITGQGTPCKVRMGENIITGSEALSKLNLEPLTLRPKEGLAIVNGTSFSAGIAANCVFAARNYLGIALATHAIMIRALLGYEEPFAAFIHECKPHPGQGWTARVMRKLLGATPEGECDQDVGRRSHLQDSYSLRCLPQYIGPIAEGIVRVSSVVETEMNGITDNPLIDSENGRFYQSGNFLGQYVGMAMDDLRRFLGLLAKHLDVQIAQLVSPEFSHGLPASLQGNGNVAFNMGLKGLQITGNSIMPQLTYLGNPLVEHFPTHAEQFNQNINGLSWGAANLATQSVELYRHYAAISLIFATQAVDLRSKLFFGHYDGRTLLNSETTPLYETVYDVVGAKPGDKKPFISNDADQSLEDRVKSIGDAIRGGGAVVSAVSPVVDSLADLEP